MLPLASLASTVLDREEFASCTNDHARITYLLTSKDFVSLLHQSSALLDEQTTYLKCAKTSSEYRDKGNEAYAARDDRLALSLYNQAIRYAPSYSREYSLALGNRSAALLNLKHHRLALQDIHRALDYLSSDEEDDIRRQRLEQRLGQCLKNQPSDEGDDEPSSVDDRVAALQSNETFNEKYPSLTSHAQIQHSSDRGRHVVSANVTSTLKPGTVILVEQAYASIVLPSAWSTHCHRCLRRLDLLLFVCSQCTRAVFCSSECLQASIVWHAFECRLTIDRLDKMAMLALRLLTKASWPYLCKNKVRFETYLKENRSPSSPADVYQWNDYESILRLETNSEKRTVDDLFHRSIQACIIGLSLVDNTSFCQDAYDNLDHQIYLCSLLLSHLQALPCNAHEISEFVYHRLSPVSSSCVEIGAGIFATLSMFNHSCNPNVIRNFLGDRVVVRLLGSVSSNDVELTDNYGCLSATMEKGERQKKLHEQYRFHCQCQPCVDQWPQYDQLPEGTGERKVNSKIFDEAFQRLIQGNEPTKDDLVVYEEFIARCDEEMPGSKTVKGKVYNSAQEAYKQCLNFFYHSMHTED